MDIDALPPSEPGKHGSFHLGFRRFAMDISAGNLLSILIFLGLLTLVAGAGYVMTTFVRDATAEHKSIREEHLHMHEEFRLHGRILQEQIRDGLEAVNYMLSLPEGARPELRMPAALRRQFALPKEGIQ